jgi:hypothetical protein
MSLARLVLIEWPAESFTGQGTGNMMKATEQHSSCAEKQLGNEKVYAADAQQSIDGFARILRIMLLSRQLSPYSSAQRDLRGILLDSYC